VRKVLICKSVLLQYSETFILEQLHSYAHWDPVLVGLRRLEAGLPLERAQVLLLYGSKPTLFHNIIRKGLGEVGLSLPDSSSACDRWRFRRAYAFRDGGSHIPGPSFRRLGCPLVVTLHGSDIIHSIANAGREASLDSATDANPSVYSASPATLMYILSQ